MPLTKYRFRTAWTIAAPAPAVFETLVDIAGYPDWWPDVRAVSGVDDETAELSCRATLPFTLTLCMTRVEQDKSEGRLGVSLTGDLEGTLAGRLSEHVHGTRVEIAQRVVANKRLLRALSPVAHPVFRANHAAMMRRGQRGLRSLLT
ncbi:polyketide cyclase [Qaidamihabitans albus]|uniref:polyketide cyclase n=1 Tax=Qaidamihabitans albus TaxID=2795733 RepID=UPI0018F126CD|nr:polyketide cyclase [Qaidamihabitans albus]